MIACPNCGGNVKFSIAAQQMSCEYCNSLFDPYAFDNKTKDAQEVKDFEATIFTCPQCGGEILSTDDAAAGFCSFCGASTILYSRISTEHRPDYIIPFQVTKDQCKESYSNLMKKAIYAPKELRDPDYIDGFRGIYMPYWAFHISQNGHFDIPAKKETRRGDYVYTDHVILSGDVNAYYKGLSYDASASFADNISEALAPYDVKSMQPFTPGFFSGFYADVANVPSNVYESSAVGSANTNTINQIKKVPAFSPYSPEGLSISGDALNTKVESADYSMFPVWFMSYKNGDRVAYATVNGQTGKVVADIPIDIKKYAIGSSILTIPLIILLNLMLTLTPVNALLVCSILGILILGIFTYEISAIMRKDSNADDLGKHYLDSINNPSRLGREPQPQQQPKKSSGLSRVVSFVLIVAAVIYCIFMIKSHQFSSGTIAVIASCICLAISVFASSMKSTASVPVKGSGIIVTSIGAIVSAVVCVLNPISDWYYYCAAIIFLVSVFLGLTDVIKAYNVLSTRKLPQFSKQGGDDRA